MNLDAFPPDLQDAFRLNAFNGVVGSTLVSESDRVRVWHLVLPAGARCLPHRHVLDYFWTVHRGGRARDYVSDGTTEIVEFRVGDTEHMTFARDEYLLHTIENVGDTELVFTTVEFLESVNAPLPLPETVAPGR